MAVWCYNLCGPKIFMYIRDWLLVYMVPSQTITHWLHNCDLKVLLIELN